jgi:hypothetical protein
MSVNWSKVKLEVDRALEYFDTLGVKPSLRTLYYRLVSVGALPHTDSAYKTLSRKCVEWRMEGHYPWDFLSDTTRVRLGGTNDEIYDEGEIERFESELEDQLEEVSLEKILSELFDHLMPSFDFGRWANQPTVVEVWVEKEAMAKTLSAWLMDKYITIRVNRGYSSWTFIYDNVNDLGEIADRHDKVAILYLGDFDPSGLDIDRFLAEALEYFGIDPEKIEFRRFALTQEQIDRYSLPPIEVNGRDPRAGRYIQIYGDRAWELDALLAYAPEEFRRELRDAVDNYFDEDVASEVESRANELMDQAYELLRDVKKRAIKRIREAVGDLEEWGEVV